MAEETDKKQVSRERLLLGGSPGAVPSFVVTCLRREGYQVETVTDGSKVVEALREARADIAVVDLMIPGKNGVEILREVRGMGIPVILFSAHSGVRLAVEAMKLGAADYLLQPVQA